MSKVKANSLTLIVSDALNMQRQLFNAGHENSGASIDVYDVVVDAVSLHEQTPARAQLLEFVKQAVGVHTMEVLKFAKELDPRVVSMIRARVAGLV